jgi:hypothetical protein
MCLAGCRGRWKGASQDLRWDHKHVPLKRTTHSPLVATWFIWHNHLLACLQFTEGTQLAVRGVLEQWGSRQWAQLRSVCSGRLVDRMQQSLVELEREHRLQLQGITVDQVTTELASCNLWLTEHVR